VGLKGGGLELLLDVTCRSPQDAAKLSTRLAEITRRLRDLIATERHAPDPRDLSGVLVAGRFEQRETRVLGRWPLDRAFLEMLAGGSL
jgi:hypothetical protein